MTWRKLFNLAEQSQAPPPPDADYWYEPFRGGGKISVADALSIPPYSSGLRYLSETLGSLPAQLYMRDEVQGSTVARDHEAYSLLHDQPNEYQTSFEYWDGVVKDLHNHGIHVSELVTNAAKTVVEIKPLDPTRVRIVRDKELGIRLFQYTDESGRRAYFTDPDVLFIPGPYSDEWNIKSTLDVFSDTLGVSLIAREYIRGCLKRGGIGTVFAQFPTIMNPDVKKKWSDFFTANFGGARNAGKVPIMDGSELKSLNVKHNEMQLAELQQFYIAEIARILRVPNHKLQDLTRSTNNNIEHQGIEAVIDCIRPLAARIEKRVNISILGSRERQRFYFEFDLDGLLRGDSEAQAALLNAEFQNAVRTPNESRKKRNLSRINDPNADKLFVQGATIPIDMAGQQQSQPQKETVAK